MNTIQQKYLKEEIQYLLDNNFIQPSKNAWSSPCILVSKPDKCYRLCTDYRTVSNATKTNSFPIARIKDCIDKIGNANYITKFDLLKGFWQIPLTERAKEISAFVTSDGLFQYNIMPFDMKNSSATFQRLVNTVISGLDGCDAYIDDVIIHNNTFEDHLQSIRKLFNRLSDANLTINLSKSEFCHAVVTFLCHEVGRGKLCLSKPKLKPFLNFLYRMVRNNSCVFLAWLAVTESSVAIFP